MRKLMLVVLSLAVFCSVAMAQSKIDTKWHCPKATTEHKLDVGDAPDHSYWIGQGACEATASEGPSRKNPAHGRNSEMYGKRPSTFTATTP